MVEEKAIENLEIEDSASQFGKQSFHQKKAGKEAKMRRLQNSIDALQALNKGVAEQDSMDPDNSQIDHDTGEDADDEFDTDDDDCVKILPLNIEKAETGRGSDQVHPSTNQTEQDTQTTAHLHDQVKWTDILAQAGNNSAEASLTAQVALDHISPRVPTPYPEPFSQFPELLHPSPPLRRRKGSNNLREDSFNSPATQNIMPNSWWAQDALRGQIQDHAAKNSDNSNPYLTPNQRGKMPEARNSQDAFSGEEYGNTAKTDTHSDFSASSEGQVLKPKSSGLEKAHAVLGYGDGDEITQKKSTTDQAASAKAVHKKKSFRNFFKRKASKEPTTPPSPSSGKTTSGKVISAPTLIDASPNAKALLDSAPSLTQRSPSAKNVVNFSRPLPVRSTSDVSSGSPAGRGRSKTILHGTNPFSGASTTPGDFIGGSGVIPVGPYTSTVGQNAGSRLPNADRTQNRDNTKSLPAHGKEASDEHGAISENLATKTKANADDSDPFDPSDYSGDENSVRQAVAVPIIFRGRARLIDIPPRRRSNTAAPGNGRLVGSTVTSCTTPLTDSEAEALGAQDADRYYYKASSSQTRATNITGDGPSIDPAYQNLIAKPANEIAAKEMARIKAAREARTMGGGVGIPRIDYGEPDQHTALGASGPTDEERAHARALTARLAADASGQVQNGKDNKTARGRFEGC